MAQKGVSAYALVQATVRALRSEMLTPETWTSLVRGGAAYSRLRMSCSPDATVRGTSAKADGSQDRKYAAITLTKLYAAWARKLAVVLKRRLRYPRPIESTKM